MTRKLNEGGADVESVFVALGNERRRHVLAALDDRATPATLPDLARFVAARESGHDPTGVPAARYRSVRVTLWHVHLPKLAEAGLVERHEGGVSLVDTPVAEQAADLTEAPFAESSLDAAFEALANRRRRRAVAALQQAGGSASLSDLAEAVDESGTSSRETAVSLAHVHLPKLAEAGIVTHDREERRVRFDGLPWPCERVLEALETADGQATESGRGDDLLVSTFE